MGSIPKLVTEFKIQGFRGVDSNLIMSAVEVSTRLNKPIFLISGWGTDGLGTIWANEIAGHWSYVLWESINHVPAGISGGDFELVSYFFKELDMILITDDENIVRQIQEKDSSLLRCTYLQLSQKTCLVSHTS
jgi:hypothetical protein